MTQPNGQTTIGLPEDAGYSDIINYYLGQWGLSSLAGLVQQLGQSGASNDQISLSLQQSDAYKQRFSGNAQRIANGLGALNPASYIALEDSYKQVLNQLPAQFRQNVDFNRLVGGDVSASELSSRVKDANDAWVNAPQSSRDAWTQYGFGGAAGAVASILDPTTAEPLIQQQVTAAGIGGAALNQGLQLTSQETAMAAAQKGVTIQQAQGAYQQIAQRLGTDTAIGNRFGEQFGQQQQENATLLGNADALNQQQRLYAEESAQFKGHGGASANSESNNPGSNY